MMSALEALGSKERETIQVAQEIAKRAIAGEVPLLLACVRIEALVRGYSFIDRDISRTLRGISSECDGMPLGEERQYWDLSALQNQDREIEQYTASVRKPLVECFEWLIQIT